MKENNIECMMEMQYKEGVIMNNKVKKVLKIVGLTLLAILAVVILAFVGVFIYSKTYSIPAQDAKIENTTGLVQAHNRALYDVDGNIVQLCGVNAGQILLQEGWMSPFALEPSKNEDGSYVKDADGSVNIPVALRPYMGGKEKLIPTR